MYIKCPCKYKKIVTKNNIGVLNDSLQKKKKRGFELKGSHSITKIQPSLQPTKLLYTVVIICMYNVFIRTVIYKYIFKKIFE